MRELKTPKTSLLLLSLFSFHLLSLARDTLTLNQSLSDGETLISSGGAFALGFFSPFNTTNRYLGIWYNNIKVHTIVWVANRQNPVPHSSGANLTLTTTGDLVITHNASGGKIWSLITANTTNPILQLLDSGNLVIREDHTEGGSEFLWQSFDYPTDTLLPGMKLGWDLTKGLNRNLTAWRTLSDPSPGPYTISMDIRGDPGLAMFRGTTRLWRSGPWNGLEITGIPEMLNYTGFTFHFIDNATDIYYSYDITDPTITTRLVANGSSGGMAQRYVWLDDPGVWSVFWYTPKTPCDVFSPCGPYGLCDPNANPMCSCLQGFKPKNLKDWQASNGTGGCVRKTALGCERNGTVSDGGGDGFMRMKNAWLPDTTVVTENKSMSVEECREACFKNCSCTGYAAADVRNGGSGCLIWAVELEDLEFFVNGGQDLYIRLAASDLTAMSSAEPQNSHKNRAKTAVTATVSVLLGVILLFCIGCFAWRRTKRMKTRGINGGNYGPWQNERRKEKEDLELPLFDLATVMVATDNFRPENKLGEGGYGPVYKGKLREGQEIAVKRLSDTSIQGADEFKNEVTLIAKLQHRNLVRLLGCCVQGDERMLIYEYMHNKSLDFFLFGKVDSVHLDWSTRFRIIVGIARGLLYLHQDSRFRIIHRDLKASNILLDKEMIPKISDFGLARIFGGDEAITKTRRVVGTYGYMSPEYAMDGIFSVKSDVFSFGVLVLEIISGKKNKGAYISDPHQYLLGYAWNLWSEGKSVELIDPTLSYSFSITEIMRCIKVSLLCVQEGPEDRPTMPMVLLMLSSDSALLHDPKPPGFVAKKDQCESNPSSTEKELNSVNEVTITMSVGR